MNEKKKEGSIRFCTHCNKHKPDRAHHCRKCNKCILKMVYYNYLL